MSKPDIFPHQHTAQPGAKAQLWDQLVNLNKSPHHCSACGKLKLTRSGAPHKCRAPDLARWRIVEAALEFYADPENHYGQGNNPDQVCKDGGKIARHALRNLPQRPNMLMTRISRSNSDERWTHPP